MNRRKIPGRRNDIWEIHNHEFRHPLSVAGQWQHINEIDPRLLEFEIKGDWWGALASTGQTLIVTREYEHLVMALSIASGKPRITYLRLPHPSGVAIDRRNHRVYIASTRNPNMIYEFLPCSGFESHLGTVSLAPQTGTLLPNRARYFPGCLYVHDIALIDGRLHANAVGMNAVVELPDTGGYKRVWWPRCIDQGKDLFDRNYLQLNSIAAGNTVRDSFFSASAANPGARRPGHLDFPVDRRGVIFSGKTRQVVAGGLTRPHSARLINGSIWVDNSGYGEIGRIKDRVYQPVTRLPGWTRGLFHARNGIIFAGTSRIIPRFRRYAPGLNWRTSKAGIHAIELRTGRLLGSLYWPNGNQIFAIEGVGTEHVCGFPLTGRGVSSSRRVGRLFFTGRTQVR